MFKWTIRPTDSDVVDRISRTLFISPLKAKLLIARDIETAEDALHFLDPSMEHLHDPFLFNEMKVATGTLHRAVTDGRRILVHGDYDADGICGAALLYKTLKRLGADVHYFVPDRARDGYGLASRVMERGVEVGLDLVISVDCGSSDGDVVSYLAGRGIEVIITDHHETSERMPGATAFLNPKLPVERYPFRELTGVGVAFKLLQGLEKTMGVNLSLEEQLDLVALGTLGDYAVLVDENRTLTRLGLDRLALWKRPGLAALRRESGLSMDGFSARQVCFTLVPRLNSPGRIGSARDVVELLVSEDGKQASGIAREIEEINKRRRAHDRNVTAEATYLADVVLKRGEPSALVFSSSSWHEGVVGIGAARLAERYHLPSVLIAVRDGKGKGSVRSAGRVDVKAALERCAAVLGEFGGHKEAGGFSIGEKMIPEFQKMFEDAVAELAETGEGNERHLADAEIRLSDCGMDLVTFIDRLRPFGPGNPEPLFLIQGLKPEQPCLIVGDSHLKMTARDSERNLHNLIGFSMGRKWHPVDVLGSEIDILVHIRKNDFRGRSQHQLQINAIRYSLERHGDRGGMASMPDSPS